MDGICLVESFCCVLCRSNCMLSERGSDVLRFGSAKCLFLEALYVNELISTASVVLFEVEDDFHEEASHVQLRFVHLKTASSVFI